jgi:hypothetical protein
MEGKKRRGGEREREEGRGKGREGRERRKKRKEEGGDMFLNIRFSARRKFAALGLGETAPRSGDSWSPQKNSRNVCSFDIYISKRTLVKCNQLAELLTSDLG